MVGLILFGIIMFGVIFWGGFINLGAEPVHIKKIKSLKISENIEVHIKILKTLKQMKILILLKILK